MEMERQLEGEAGLPTAGGSPRCDPVGDDEDEMSICDAVDEAEAGSNTISPAARGEALDDEAPTVMAEGGEASSSAPPAKRPRGTKSKPKKGGRKAKMGADQIRNERERGSVNGVA